MKRREMITNYANGVERERIRLNYTQAQMANALEMSLSTYKRMVSGETDKIDLYVTHLMHELTGKWTFELCGESGGEKEIVRKLRKLSESQLRFVSGIVDLEVAFLKENQDAEDYISVLVPTGNMEDGMIYDSGNVIKVNAAPYRKKFGDDLHCGIMITSSHLHPVYNQGDILLICRKPVRDGDTGVFVDRDNNRIYIRKLHKTHPCTLVSVNGYGNDIVIDDRSKEDMEKWLKFGYVLTKIR